MTAPLYPDFDQIKEWIDKGVEDKKSHLVIALERTKNEYEPVYMDVTGSALDEYTALGKVVAYNVIGTTWLTEAEAKEKDYPISLCMSTYKYSPEEIYCLRPDAETPLSEQIMEYRAYFFE